MKTDGEKENPLVERNALMQIQQPNLERSTRSSYRLEGGSYLAPRQSQQSLKADNLIESLRERKGAYETALDNLEKTRGVMNSLVDKTQRAMQKRGSFTQDVVNMVQQGQLGFGRRALARITPRVLRNVPVLGKAIGRVVDYLDFKTALTQTYADMQADVTLLGTELEESGQKAGQLEIDIGEALNNRREAFDAYQALDKERIRILQQITAFQQQLGQYTPGTQEYLSLDTQVIELEQQARQKVREGKKQLNVVKAADDTLALYCTLAPALQNHLEAAETIRDKAIAELQMLENTLQQTTQLVAVGDAAERVVHDRELARGVHNAALVLTAQRGAALQEVAREVTGGSFYEPRIVSAALQISEDARKLAAQHQEQLLGGSSFATLEKEYAILGLQPDANLEEVAASYRRIISGIDEKRDPVRFQLVQDAHSRIMGERYSEQHDTTADAQVVEPEEEHQ